MRLENFLKNKLSVKKLIRCTHMRGLDLRSFCFSRLKKEAFRERKRKSHLLHRIFLFWLKVCSKIKPNFFYLNFFYSNSLKMCWEHLFRSVLFVLKTLRPPTTPCSISFSSLGIHLWRRWADSRVAACSTKILRPPDDVAEWFKRLGLQSWQRVLRSDIEQLASGLWSTSGVAETQEFVDSCVTDVVDCLRSGSSVFGKHFVEGSAQWSENVLVRSIFLV